MDDPLVVNVVESRGHSGADGGSLALRECSRAKARREVRPLDKIHHQVEVPVELAGIEQADEVRVGQTREGADLRVETFLVGPRRIGEQLHCHWPLQARVERPVDSSHPAATDE